MSKWYNFETMIRSLKDDLRVYLHEIGVKYEISECFDGWHFEVYASPEEVTLINNWLDENTITEVV